MAQKSQYAASLALKIIREQYGEIPETVTRCLIQRGRQALGDVIRFTGLPSNLARQALLILVQQNCVAVFSLKDDDPKANRPVQYLYEVQMERTLQNLRKARFLLHIREEFDAKTDGGDAPEEAAPVNTAEVAEAVVDLLLQHGRLRVDQIVPGACGKISLPDQPESHERVRNVFMQLVHARYVERAPPTSLPPPKPQLHPNAVRGKRGSKQGPQQAPGDAALAARSMEEVSYEKERFKLTSDLMFDGLADGADADAAEEQAKDQGSGRPTKKRRKDAAERVNRGTGLGSSAPVDSGAPSDNRSILWRVNNEEFNRRFRHQACVELVQEKWDKDAGAVLAAMLSVSRNFETKVTTDITVQISVDEASAGVTRLLNAREIEPLDRGVADILRILSSDAMEFVQYVGPGPGGETYQVQLYRMVDMLRLKEVQAVVRDRFGIAGLRIFTLLLMKGQLEQKQIGDFAMLPQKDTRELLYSMLKAGFISAQDVPKSSDHAPSRTFYTWNVQPPVVYDRLAAELYRAAANVRTRLQHEIEREKEVQELIDTFRETGVLSHTLTATQKQQIHRLKQVTDVLESSLLQLDEMIAVFNDY